MRDLGERLCDSRAIRERLLELQRCGVADDRLEAELVSAAIVDLDLLAQVLAGLKAAQAGGSASRDGAEAATLRERSGLLSAPG